MQLLVAVLTFTFEKASRSGRIHYNIGVIDYIRCLEYDSMSGSLVSLPIIGSFLNFIYIVVYLFSDTKPPMKVKLQFIIRKKETFYLIF